MATKVPVIVDTVIPAGASQSGKVNISNLVVVGIIMPAVWTAANITFLAGDPRDGGNGVVAVFNPVHDDTGVEVTATTAASQFVTFRDSDVMAGVSYLKVRSGTTATPVVQAAQAVVSLVLREE